MFFRSYRSARLGASLGDKVTEELNRFTIVKQFRSTVSDAAPAMLSPVNVISQSKGEFCVLTGSARYQVVETHLMVKAARHPSSEVVPGKSDDRGVSRESEIARVSTREVSGINYGIGSPERLSKLFRGNPRHKLNPIINASTCLLESLVKPLAPIRFRS
jgi:hypothetical protein